jgi:diguanylate cyclase (GGDEF)-like protein/PAS domain S-box-containing protein
MPAPDGAAGPEAAAPAAGPSRLAWAAALAGLVVYAINAAAGSGGGDSLTDPLSLPLYFAVAGFAVLAGFAGALARDRGRTGCLLLAAGVASYACGLVYFVAFRHGQLSFPTAADWMWLAFYPLAAAGMVMIAAGHARFTRASFADAAIVVLVVLALAATLYERVLSDAIATREVPAGQVVHLLADTGLIAIWAAIGAILGWRGGRRTFLLGAGLVVMLLTDTALVRQVAGSSYAPGTALYAGWLGALLLIGLAAWQRNDGLETSAHTRATLATPTVAGVVAAGLLVADAAGSEGSAVGLIAAAAALAGVFARSVVTLAQNRVLDEEKTLVLSAAVEGIARLDGSGTILFVNEAAASMLGRPLEELAGVPMRELAARDAEGGAEAAAKRILDGTGRRAIETRLRRGEEASFDAAITCGQIRDGDRTLGSVLMFSDITERKSLEKELRYQADHDALTGLYNRRRLTQELEQQLRYSRRYRRPFALLLIDLDHFKFVNDSLGHGAGDQLLIAVAEALLRRARATDVLARLGGDEFALLLREVDEERARTLAQEIGHVVGSLELGPGVQASVGVAEFDGRGEFDADEVLVAADIALYEAKEAGGNQVSVYRGQASVGLTWVDQIRAALSEGRFVLYAQPIVALASGRVERHELLIKMLADTGDVIPAAAFLPTAERFALITEIDRWVVARGLELAADGMAVAINLSGRSIGDRTILAMARAAIDGGLDPQRVIFEITETAATTNMPAAHDFANRLTELGCDLALDDFGTGFGAFTYLKHLPAAVLKIDIDFVRDIATNPTDQQVVQAIVRIAHVLGKKTVAEGIEDTSTLALLREYGVDYGQGFGIGRPRRLDLSAKRGGRFPATGDGAAR